MHAIIAWWADNRVAANLLMIGIFVAGIIGYTKMEREMMPTIAFPGMQINVVWPGASPTDVEEQIVVRIEESLKDLENIDWIRSESLEGMGIVRILADGADDFASIRNEIEARVSAISSFPPDIEQPRIIQWSLPERLLGRVDPETTRLSRTFPGQQKRNADRFMVQQLTYQS